MVPLNEANPDFLQPICSENLFNKSKGVRGSVKSKGWYLLQSVQKDGHVAGAACEKRRSPDATAPTVSFSRAPQFCLFLPQQCSR
ncbi:hypothetical protein CEXT_240741 [Caerostris extrusa]|uniref:Uncharacterized protein n=1 Tax=Caerostris extrusa TaxID=172846 RepID=A0AAV4XFZ2_CAEEX|nr:hypothetical protein CEXT_240741 [Caerostris extrusa]